jgi:hypothetical protein
VIDWKTVKKSAEKLVLRESEKRSDSIAAANNRKKTKLLK